MKKFFNWLFLKIKSYFFFKKIRKTDYVELVKNTLWLEKNPRSNFDISEYIEYLEIGSHPDVCEE